MDQLSFLETVAVITTTVGSAEDAHRLAQAVVQSGCAACVQIEPITSHYLWQGELECTKEWRLVLKTDPAAVPDVLEWLDTQHPYEVPQLLVRMEHANSAYAAWVAEQVNAKK